MVVQLIKLVSLNGYAELSQSVWVRILTEPSCCFFTSLLYTSGELESVKLSLAGLLKLKFSHIIFPNFNTV